MQITEIDRITAAYERAANLGTIPEARRVQAVAQALGISEEMVREALERVGEAA
jgi:hypothetical protein